MKQLIIEALIACDFSNRYVELCNKYKDVDNGLGFKKDDLTNILSDEGVELKYSSQEKLFYQDYEQTGNSIRFILPFKYGFIDCSYTIWNTAKNFRLGGSFADFSLMIDDMFETKVAYKFPIACSVEELRIILKYTCQLHNDFITQLKTRMTI
jgi:hypothetical protein